MFSIAKKDFVYFFQDIIGFLIILFFSISSSIPLFILKGNYNILNSGFGDLQIFFSLLPWLLLVLIPSLCMRSFSEENKNGTLTLLLTHPIPLFKIVLGKFIGIFCIFLCILLPTGIYAIIIESLLKEDSVFDWGSALGAYMGLIFLSSVFISISIWASSLFKNQISAFILGVCSCLFFFYGWEELVAFSKSVIVYKTIKPIGIYHHYQNISKGVFSMQDFIYFVGITYFFLLLTKIKLEKRKK